MQAELVSLNVSCCPDGDNKFIDVNGPTQIVFAVTNSMTGCDIILISIICNELRTAKPCLVMQYLMLTVLVLTNRLSESDEPQTDEQPVQSDTVSYDKGDDLLS